MENRLIEVVNRQRKIKIEAASFREFARHAAALLPEAVGKSFTVAFVSDRKMRRLNQFFRGKNTTTDVLSFENEREEFESADDDFSGDYLGDIVISLEQAARQAAENDLPFDAEIRQLILHGVLHLCGYDHETDTGEMNRLELRLRDKLRI